MTGRKTLYDGASQAAWGYLFLYFDLKLGSVSILPAFVGYLLFLSAIEKLKGERRDLALLRPLGILLAAGSGAEWLCSWAGVTLDGRFPALDLILAAAGLYFHFQLFTDFAALAETYQRPGQDLDRRLLRWRTVQAVLTTTAKLLSLLMLRREGDWEWLLFSLVFVGIAVGGCLMAAVFSLRALFREEEQPGGPPAGTEAP